MGIVLFRRHVLTFCKQWIHLYALPAPPNCATAILAHPPAPPAECDPLVSHKWQWRIDSLVVAPRVLCPAPAWAGTASCADSASCDAGVGMEAGAEAEAFPPIDVLIRFDTWFPWPVNILHHYVLTPNPAFTSSSSSCSSAPSSPTPHASPDSPPRSTPYLHAGGAPAMAHSIPSPIRLFTPSDMVLGRRGTALWLDAQAYESGPAQAGDHGQRIAGRMLAAPPPPSSSSDRTRELHPGEGGGEGQGGEGEGGGGGEGDRVSPGWFGEEGPMVFHMQEEDDGWNRLALDEEEGRIAVGTVYGRVHLFEYAPQVASVPVA